MTDFRHICPTCGASRVGSDRIAYVCSAGHEPATCFMTLGPQSSQEVEELRAHLAAQPGTSTSIPTETKEVPE